jgi:hypothetical protein
VDRDGTARPEMLHEAKVQRGDVFILEGDHILPLNWFLFSSTFVPGRHSYSSVADTSQAVARCFINRVNRMIDSAQLVNAHMNILFECHLWKYDCEAQKKLVAKKNGA